MLDADDHPCWSTRPPARWACCASGGAPGTIAAHPIVRTLAGQVRRTGRTPGGGARPAARSTTVARRAARRAPACGRPRRSTYVAVEAADVTEAHRRGPGPPRLRGQRQPRAEDPDRRAAAARRGAAGRHRAAGSRSRTTTQSEDLVAARRFAERIQHESARLGRLVNELLELTRLQGAEPLPSRSRSPLDWVIAEVVDRTRTAAVGQGHRGGRTPARAGSPSTAATASSPPRWPTWWRTRSPTPARTPRSIADHAPGRRLDRDRVTDQGIGIAPHDVDRIFERFYRADQARSRATGGTGLGLAIVKHIATNHGGRVDVTSTLGDGSTFTLRLPARPPEAALPLPPAIEIESEALGRPAEGEGTTLARVLVVEDEESFSDALSYMLRKEGFEVSVAATGTAALTEFDRTGADIVLLDLMLPEMSGTEVCRQLRQRSARADHHGHRPGQRDRQGGRAGDRRRRLRDQAVLAARAGRPDPRGAAPPGRRGGRGDHADAGGRPGADGRRAARGHRRRVGRCSCR